MVRRKISTFWVQLFEDELSESEEVEEVEEVEEEIISTWL